MRKINHFLFGAITTHLYTSVKQLTTLDFFFPTTSLHSLICEHFRNK